MKSCKTNREIRGVTWLDGLVIMIILVIAGIILFPILAGSAPPSRRTACLSQLKQLSLSLTLYSYDFNDKLPLRDSWMDVAETYAKARGILHCPGVQWKSEKNLNLYGFSFNSTLSTAEVPKVSKPEEVPLIYDSINLARNASDPFVSLPNPPRDHKGKRVNLVAYLDTHAKALPNKGTP